MIKKIVSILKQYEERTAFNISKKHYTYKELEFRIVEIQQEIIKHKTQEPVVIIYDNNFDSYASILAVLFLGTGFIPINPLNPLERNIKILRKTESKLILNTTPHSYFNLPHEILTKSISSSENRIIYNAEDSDLAYIFFTSGSTGEPKGVPVKISNLNAFLMGFNKLEFETDYKDKFLQMFELTFDLSVFSYLYPLTIGACVYTVPNIGLKYGEVLKILTNENISFALMVPSIINSLKPYFKQIKLPNLKYSLFCGEALLMDNALGWNKCTPNGKTFNVYGPTEATIFCTSYEVREDSKEYNGIVSIGKAMFNTKLSIESKNTSNLERNQKGELILSGGQVVKEYFKNEEKSLECFSTKDNVNSYKTGDICFTDIDGDYFYVGRIDSQVQIQGFRVELSEVEYEISSQTHLNTSVITIDDDTKIIAFVEGDVNLDILLQGLREQLPDYMIPKKIISIKKLPLNKNGKVDKNKLKSYVKSNL
ncbi:MAG: AMP-binding protein [Salinivirgaceae bacterium]|nr:AMP-binding protein [Salinivirgaceae bacterium]